MKTKYEKGELVWVKNSKIPGIIMDVRPWVYGGSGIMSWRDRDTQGFSYEVTHEEKRSEYLVVSPSGDFQSWFDEQHLSMKGDIVL
jgi:hypothetical protein